MIDEPRDSGISLSNFFDRCELPLEVKDDCHAFVQSRFSGPVRPVTFQGYCSYTFQVGDDTIVQFRPATHRLDLSLISTARKTFPGLVPDINYLGELGKTNLHAYVMNKLPGISLLDLRSQASSLKQASMREQMVKDFARLQVTSWKSATEGDHVQKRLVGSSLDWRLQLMVAGLPPRMEPILNLVKTCMGQIKSLPWTLSHGDFIPGNIMTCPVSEKILGLLDWAEAEFLPFGVGMYGLEELLGEVNNSGNFIYYPNAGVLRKTFWSEVTSAIPELTRDPCLMATVQCAQILGILLWRGIAFDDGKLNRVVCEGRDDEDIQRLDTFLSSPDGPVPQICSRPSSSIWSAILSKGVFRWLGFRRGWLFDI